MAQPDRYAERYGNLTLTPRDYEILDLIYRYRSLEQQLLISHFRCVQQLATRSTPGEGFAPPTCRLRVSSNRSRADT